MRRHFTGAYILATVDLLVGCPLAVGAWQLSWQIHRHHAPRLDDFLAASALALAGVAILAAAATMLQSRIPYGIIRGARIGAAIAEVWMILAGVGIILVGRARGGDWAGIAYLAGSAFVAVGTLLLLLSLFGLRYLRRLRA
jgi:hypothetical protein